MELWVRSQDKHNLIKVTNLSISRDYDYKDNEHYYTIREYEYGTVLGYYKSKERALEILDEIQNILKPKYILDSSSIKPDGDSWVENGMILQNYNANAKIEELSTYVYEMPEE